MSPKLLPAQCRAARALVEMEKADLAAKASVPLNDIDDFEKALRTPVANNLAAIQQALEAAGVIFVDANEDGPGVRLRKSMRNLDTEIGHRENHLAANPAPTGAASPALGMEKLRHGLAENELRELKQDRASRLTNQSNPTPRTEE